MKRLQELPKIGLSFIILILFLDLIGGTGCTQRQETRRFSWSIAEAKRRGTFICEIDVLPKPLVFAGKKITIEAAWLERRPDSGYSLCFRIDQGKEVFKEVSSPFFVRDERDAGLEERHGRDWLQFIEGLDSDDLSSVRLSLINSWKDQRAKDIHFVRKEK